MSGEMAELVTRLLSGDVRALARAVSLVENNSPEAQQILSLCFPHAGRAMRIGITGAPGAGKSTLVDRLAHHYRAQQLPVGVIAVDPTSPFTGGALLGDRIRLRDLHADPGFYMRSMATRGAIGGMAQASAGIATVLEASGKQRILLETVGVGQDEINIVRVADITIVVLVPGMGDDVQSLKAGLMEIADIFVVNKSDHPGAERVEQEVRALQSLSLLRDVWIPPVVQTVASSGKGIETLIQSIDSFWSWLADDQRLTAKRGAQWRAQIMEMVQNEICSKLREHRLSEEALTAMAQQIVLRQQNPYQLVPQLVEHLLAQRP